MLLYFVDAMRKGLTHLVLVITPMKVNALGGRVVCFILKIWVNTILHTTKILDEN